MQLSLLGNETTARRGYARRRVPGSAAAADAPMRKRRTIPALAQEFKVEKIYA